MLENIIYAQTQLILDSKIEIKGRTKAPNITQKYLIT